MKNFQFQYFLHLVEIICFGNFAQGENSTDQIIYATHNLTKDVHSTDQPTYVRDNITKDGNFTDQPIYVGDNIIKDQNATDQPNDVFNEDDIYIKTEFPNIITYENKVAALYAHNYVRALHGVPECEWDEDLAEGARRWSIYLAKQRRLIHDNSSRNYSDNLYKSYGVLNATDICVAVIRWYETIKQYSFGHHLELKNYLSGTFTALVWNTVKYIGIGTSFDDSTKQSFIVARYSPPPNRGDFLEHVRAQLKSIPGDGTYIPTLEELFPLKWLGNKTIPRNWWEKTNLTKTLARLNYRREYWSEPVVTG